MDYTELLQMLCLLALPRLAELDTLSTGTASPPPLDPPPLDPPPLDPPMPPFTALRQLIGRACSCGELDFFGTRPSSSSGSSGRSEWLPVAAPASDADRLREVLASCASMKTSSSSSSSCIESLAECLPEGVRRVAEGLGGARDLLTRTAHAFRVFELHQINSVITELLTDTDMQAVAPEHLVQHTVCSKSVF